MTEHILLIRKLRYLDRELRNSINHEYEEDPARLAELFRLLIGETPALFGYLQRMLDYCRKAYGHGQGAEFRF